MLAIATKRACWPALIKRNIALEWSVMTAADVHMQSGAALPPPPMPASAHIAAAYGGMPPAIPYSATAPYASAYGPQPCICAHSGGQKMRRPGVAAGGQCRHGISHSGRGMCHRFRADGLAPKNQAQVGVRRRPRTQHSVLTAAPSSILTVYIRQGRSMRCRCKD